MSDSLAASVYECDLGGKEIVVLLRRGFFFFQHMKWFERNRSDVSVQQPQVEDECFERSFV